jgi:hypothetical protein
MSDRIWEEMRAVIRRCVYSIHTVRSCCDWVKRYVSYHKIRTRDGLSSEGQTIDVFVTHLVMDLHWVHGIKRMGLVLPAVPDPWPEAVA